MKSHYLIFLISVVCAELQAQTVEDLYYEPDTTSLNVNSEDFMDFTSRVHVREEKLTKKLRKANNNFLHSFLVKEDKILHSLCQVPSNISANPQIELPQNPISHSGVRRQTDKINDCVLPAAPHEKTKDKTPLKKESNPVSNEMQAEALMMDAWYSFNRFENQCKRAAQECNKQKFPELDSIDLITKYLEKRIQLAPSGKSIIARDARAGKRNANNNQTNINLKSELRRTELIEQYIKERQQFLSKALEKYPNSESILLPLTKCGYYFNQYVTEYKSIFSCRSSLEKILMRDVINFPGFERYLAQLTSPSPVSAVNPAPHLKFEDLLSTAPESTKEKIISLQKPLTEKVEAITSKSKVDLNNSKEINNCKNATLNDLGIKNRLNTFGVDSLPIQSSCDTVIAKSSTKSKTEKLNNKKWNPNPLRSKRVIDRFNYGGNLQLDNKTTFFPTSLQLAGSISYQYSKKGNIGLGYSRIQAVDPLQRNNDKNIGLNGQGMRSFIDFSLKRTLFIQGGYEINSRRGKTGVESSLKHGATNTISKSALLGLKIKYPVKNKLSKPTLEILYDFLHSQTGQPAFIMRAGIELNRKHSYKK